MWQSISTNVLETKFWELFQPLSSTNSKLEMSLGADHYHAPGTHFRRAKRTLSLLAHWELEMLSEGWAGSISKINCLLMSCHL